MKQGQELPLLVYGENRANQEEQKMQEIARGKMMEVTEQALGALGICKEDTPGKLLRMVVRLCGLGIYTRTRKDLVDELGCTIRTLQRAMKRLQELDLIKVGSVEGRKDLVAIRAVWSKIVESSEKASGVVWLSKKEGKESDISRDMDATSSATLTRHESDMDATSTRHDGDMDATFENLSLYNANTLNRCRRRSRFEGNAAATADEEVLPDDVSMGEISAAFEKLVQAFPRHQRQAVQKAAWELAYIGLAARKKTGFDHIAEQCSAIRTKRLESPMNYLRGCARGICQDINLDYFQLRASAPEPATPIVTESTRNPSTSVSDRSPVPAQERSTGFSKQDWLAIANFGRVSNATDQ